MARLSATSIKQRIKPIAQQLIDSMMRRINLSASPGTGLRSFVWLDSLLDKYRQRRRFWPYPVGLVHLMSVAPERAYDLRGTLIQNVYPRFTVRVPSIRLDLRATQLPPSASLHERASSPAVSTVSTVVGAPITHWHPTAPSSSLAFKLHPVAERTNDASPSPRERDVGRIATLVSNHACEALDSRDSGRGGQPVQDTTGYRTYHLLQRIVHRFRRIEHRYNRLPGEAGHHAPVHAKPQVLYDSPPKSPGGADAQYAAVSTRPGIESEFGKAGAQQTASGGGLAGMNLSSVTDHVMRQLDQRFTAWRERMGQV